VISRRQLLEVGVTGLLAPNLILGQSEDWRADLLKAQRNQNPVTLGRILPPPDNPVWREVDGILDKAPRPQSTPVEVANYFLTSVPAKFQQAWPESDTLHPTLANPLIVRFFLSTHTVPAGDTTAWCGAFVNWCLQRASIRGTESASSQSFATWGDPVWAAEDSGLPINAKRGDLAVFRQLSNPAHGHVAFYMGLDPSRASRVLVLGGNQLTRFNGSKLHVIDVDSLRIDSASDLELIAIRTKEGLRHA
jgi:uncharacterized protein (TIGR02594 family)